MSDPDGIADAADLRTAALMVAKETIKELGDDEDRLSALASLSAISGHDEDGNVRKYKMYIMAKAMIVLCSERTR